MLERVLQKLRVDEYKRRMFRDFFFYVLFIVIFLTIIFLGRDIRRVYYVESALRDKFIEEEFLQNDSYIYKSFDDIGELSEFWQFMRGPFVGALASVNAFEQGYILSFNRIIGAPRIRQVRVRDKCSLSAPLASFFEHCYPNYEYDLRSTEPFGPDVDQYLAQLSNSTAASNSTVVDQSKLRVWTFRENVAPPVYGWLSSYEGDGFVVDLSYNSDVSRALIAELEASDWVDAQTRAVIVTVNVYNANINSFTTITMVVEIDASGGFSPWSYFRSFRADNYLDGDDKARLVLEVLFLAGLIGWIGYTLQQLFWIKRRGGSALMWFTRPWWNLVDMLNKVMLLSFVCVYLAHTLRLTWFRHRITDLDQTSDFSELEDLGWSAEQMYYLIAANIFIGTLTIFKFLSVNLRMSMLWRTLMKASGDLLAFIIFFFIMFIGFVFTGNLLFGTALSNFRTVGRSFLTCFQMLLGEFTYEEMEERGNRVLAPIYFGLFMVLVFFVLVNMFVAIVTDSYAIVHEQVAQTDSIGTALRLQIQRSYAHARRNLARFFDAKNFQDTLAGRALNESEVVKYINAIVLRVAVRYKQKPLRVTRGELERLLDAPREDVDRLYDRIVDYAAVIEDDDARDIEEEQQEKLNDELEGVVDGADVASAHELLHPLRAGRVTADSLQQSAQRLAARLEQIEKKATWLLREPLVRSTAASGVGAASGASLAATTVVHEHLPRTPERSPRSPRRGLGASGVDNVV